MHCDPYNTKNAKKPYKKILEDENLNPPPLFPPPDPLDGDFLRPKIEENFLINSSKSGASFLLPQGSLF